MGVGRPDLHPSPSARNCSSQQMDSTRALLPTTRKGGVSLDRGRLLTPTYFAERHTSEQAKPLSHRRLIRPSTGTKGQKTTSVSVNYFRLGSSEQTYLTASTKTVSTSCSLIMTALSIAVGLAVLTGLGLLYTVLVALLSPLRNVPGPASARFTNLFYLNRVRHGRFHHENKTLHSKYGPVLRLGEDLVSIDDPSAVKTIYGSK